MANELKQIRGQIRQIVKELLPEVLSNAFVEALEKRLNEKLEAIHSNQKNLQSYLLRNEIQKAEARKVLDKVETKK